MKGKNNDHPLQYNILLRIDPGIHIDATCKKCVLQTQLKQIKKAAKNHNTAKSTKAAKDHNRGHAASSTMVIMDIDVSWGYQKVTDCDHF